MPDIPLLDPVVLRGVVERFMAPESHILTQAVPETPWPYPYATWDVIRGSRNVAKPNVPNAEAHVVSRLGRSQETAAFVYLREKKVFEPTTIHWIRTPGELAARNAEQAVLREVGDLNMRFDNFVEFCLWQALSGTLSLDYPDVQATVDYKLASSHQATVGTNWATATAIQIVADVRAWKRLIARDGRVPARTAYLTEPTFAKIFDAFAASSLTLMSDRMRDQYYSAGVMDGFLGLNWVISESVYDNDSGVQTLFIPDGAVAICNMTDGRPIEVLQGPSADDEAPDNFTGKFAKTWKEKDPSARQYLLEYSFIPIITRPEQFVYVANVH